MIGLLSGPSGVLTADEVVARRHALPLEPASAQPAPIDAVHAVENVVESDDAGARHAHQQQELTTDERLRQDEALHAGPDDPSTEAASKDEVESLAQRDAEVRRHEQAHMAAGGALSGAASYRFERGPDGRNYAVEGEVSIDTSSEPDPDKTIDKMRQVRRAALAPSDPSSQDQSVAAKAARVIRAAEAELASRRVETLRQAAIELARARDASVEGPGERESEQAGESLAGAPPPAAHQVSEYQRQAVMSAGSRLSSIPPPPAGFDSSV